MRPKYDSIVIGILTGTVITTLGYFAALASNDYVAKMVNRPFSFKESTVALFAICLNMLAVGYFRRRYMNKSLRGLTLLVMTLAIGWFIYFGQNLLDGNQ